MEELVTARKTEARYGASRSFRKRIKGLDGQYHDVCGRTIAERGAAVDVLRASRAAEEQNAADPFVWQYAAAVEEDAIHAKASGQFCPDAFAF